MTVRIIVGDALKRLHELPDEILQVWITSPPYWGLRDYDIEPLVWGGEPLCEHVWEDATYIRRSNDEKPGNKQNTNRGSTGRDNPVHNAFCQLCGAWLGSLGLEPTPELYVQHLVEIFREARRVLRKDGTLWVNLGDSYSAGGGKQVLQTKDASHGLDGIRARTPDMSSKQLLGIPWRVALALQADGWWLRSACPWLKRNSMPESTTDRPTTSHEYWFLFAKSGDTQYWTHRELPGTRKKPKADYRWIHASGQELTEEPEGNWKCQKADCPECGGTGSIGMEAFGQEFISTTCGRCKGEKRIKAWQRVNLWKGHDYFWDGEAIKEHCQSGPSDIKKMVESRNRIGGKHKELNDPYAKASNATNIGQKRAVGNPAGRNRRTSDFFFESLDVTIREHERYLVHLKHIRDNGGLLLDKNGDPLAFSVPTRGFKGAHFATFPCDLIEPLIRASTSEKGCCPDCGAPWRRATEIERFHTQWGGPTTKNHQVGMGNAQSFIREGKPGCTSTKTKTVGWSPTCDCPPHDPVPCVVGDTFGGAATVGLVADRSGRDALLIELNEEYAEMGRQRIAEDAGPMLLDLEIIGNSQVIEPEQLEMFAITL